MTYVLNETKSLELSQKFKGQKIYKHHYLSYIIVLDTNLPFFCQNIE